MDEQYKNSRRKFIKNSAIGVTALSTPFYGFNIIKTPKMKDEILGHGDFKYRVERDWGNLDPSKTPVNNCHEMVMDSKRRLIMVTDHPTNNVIIYSKSGKLLESWTLDFKGAHGLTIHNEGGEDFLYITDINSGKVVKTTTDGRILLTINHPSEVDAYHKTAAFKPTETAIGPSGDIYIADGYGSQFILQYSREGALIRKFGGRSFSQQKKFVQAHGVTLDTRDQNNPTLLCTARIKNTFKRFSLEGEFIEDYYLPGAFVSRAVIDGDNVYSGVCFGMTEENFNLQMNLGFVTILDKHNKVVSNPGGTKPQYRKNGSLKLMTQAQPVFKHCHDVCIDDDKNIYVCQWNAGGVYPYKLHRI